MLRDNRKQQQTPLFSASRLINSFHGMENSNIDLHREFTSFYFSTLLPIDKTEFPNRSKIRFCFESRNSIQHKSLGVNPSTSEFVRFLYNCACEDVAIIDNSRKHNYFLLGRLKIACTFSQFVQRQKILQNLTIRNKNYLNFLYLSFLLDLFENSNFSSFRSIIISILLFTIHKRLFLRVEYNSHTL